MCRPRKSSPHTTAPLREGRPQCHRPPDSGRTTNRPLLWLLHWPLRVRGHANATLRSAMPCRALLKGVLWLHRNNHAPLLVELEARRQPNDRHAATKSSAQAQRVRLRSRQASTKRRIGSNATVKSQPHAVHSCATPDPLWKIRTSPPSVAYIEAYYVCQCRAPGRSARAPEAHLRPRALCGAMRGRRWATRRGCRARGVRATAQRRRRDRARQPIYQTAGSWHHQAANIRIPLGQGCSLRGGKMVAESQHVLARDPAGPWRNPFRSGHRPNGLGEGLVRNDERSPPACQPAPTSGPRTRPIPKQFGRLRRCPRNARAR